MVHVTCAAHGLHRVAEHLRDIHPEVDSLISSVKKVFLKAPSRRQIFHDLCPNLPLPPSPVITRWGTWIEAAMYYAKNLDAIRTVLHALDEDAASIRQAKDLIELDTVKNNLIFIATNFESIPTIITSLESRTIELPESCRLLMKIKKVVKSIDGMKGESVRKKFEYVFGRNTGLHKLVQVVAMISGDDDLKNVFGEGSEIQCSPTDMYLKFAPITSCEVERSFSMYSRILTPNRRSFTMENLKAYLVVSCNRT